MIPGIVFPKDLYLYKEPVSIIKHYYFHSLISYFAF